MKDQDREVLCLEKFKASRFLEDGKHYLSIGEIELALDCFQKSIEIKPTAEAYTYLAWVISMKDDLDTAIDLCKEAHRLSPEHATPLNDIGNYLLQKGDLKDAIPWLEKAKSASQSETPHFPYINLGRVYSSLGLYAEAILEFKKALEFSPGHKEVQKVLKELEEIQNNA